MSKTRFFHYAQFGEDLTIERLFKDERLGFYVDVGCFHPRKHSNTYALYKRGWRGINIDVDPIKIDVFNHARPDDVNIATAVGNATCMARYYSRGVYSLTTSLSADFTAHKSGYREKTTALDTLDNIVGSTKHQFRPIDFLSVDVEGYDFEVIQSLNFEIYRPRIIAVESQERLFSKVVDSDLYRFLTCKDYCLVGWCGLTLIMASPAMQRQIQGTTPH